jgi:hypothetical protein
MRIEPFPSANSENNLPPANERSVSRNLSTSNGGNSSSQKLNTAQVEKNQTPADSKNQVPLPQFPEDEVTVQFDKPMNDDILIYQFLDKQSGSLILQVPSTQVLGVAHEIQNELQEQSSEEQASEQSAKENAMKHGGTADGD